jgi:hypothetical protein
MHPERAFRVINLLDVPEAKRKFWPQQACVIISNSTREILDVIQFYSNVFTESEKYQRLYPNSTAFFTQVGDFAAVQELKDKIDWCFEKKGKTYALGKGFIEPDQDQGEQND